MGAHLSCVLQCMRHNARIFELEIEALYAYGESVQKANYSFIHYALHCLYAISNLNSGYSKYAQKKKKKNALWTSCDRESRVDSFLHGWLYCLLILTWLFTLTEIRFPPITNFLEQHSVSSLSLPDLSGSLVEFRISYLVKVISVFFNWFVR